MHVSGGICQMPFSFLMTAAPQNDRMHTETEEEKQCLIRLMQS